jgi:hypothetical protein
MEYSNLKRESDTYALPDVEIFHHEHCKRELCALNAGSKADIFGECILDSDGDCCGSGWYYQFCFPGCMPESDPFGPYETYEAALEACRDECADY